MRFRRGLYATSRSGLVTWAYFPLSTIPAPYDIVWCRFPQHDSLGHPGPKPRPALVRNALTNAAGQGIVDLVYGTTKLKLSDRDLLDFVISNPREMDNCGLYRATRFDLDHNVCVPWAAEWFDVVTGTASPIIGHLSDAAIKMLQITLGLKAGRASAT